MASKSKRQKLCMDSAAPSAEPGPKRKRKRRRSPCPDEPQVPISGDRRSWKDWADDSDAVRSWIASRKPGLEKSLEGGGLVRIESLFPPEVARGVLEVVESLPESNWDLSEQAGDDEAAKHRFWSADLIDIPELAALRSIFWQLLPKFKGEPTLPIFSAGRYGASDYIGRHDDRAHVPFFGDANIYSRTVAGIWYLTKDWTDADGGALIDYEAKPGCAEERLPSFNACVFFGVPRAHAVAPVVAERYRYSIFGWWHQQGRRYDLPGESCSDDEEHEEVGDMLVKVQKAKKTKRKTKSRAAAVVEDHPRAKLRKRKKKKAVT